MVTSDTTADTRAMIAATSRMRSRPVVNAARVIVATVPRSCGGSFAITWPTSPDCTAEAIFGPWWDRDGTAAIRARTSSATLLENSVPSNAMPVAMPTWRNVELMPEAMPACCGGTTPTAVEARGGLTRPTPRPPTIIPGIRWVQVDPALSQRIGTLEVSRPATVADTRMAPDRNMTRTPVPSGEYPRMSCRYSTMYSSIAKIDAL